MRGAYELPFWVHRQQPQMSPPKLPKGLKNNIAVLLPRSLRMARELVCKSGIASASFLARMRGFPCQAVSPRRGATTTPA